MLDQDKETKEKEWKQNAAQELKSFRLRIEDELISMKDISKHVYSTQNIEFEKKDDEYFSMDHNALYDENLTRCMVCINTHGTYFVNDQFLPLRTFETPINIFMYRNAQLSCVGYTSVWSKYHMYKSLQRVWDSFSPEEVTEILNSEMCEGERNEKYPDHYFENFQKHCYKKTNRRVYKKGMKVAEKRFTFDREKDHGSVKVVCKHDYFKDENLLMNIEKENEFYLSDVIENAKSLGMKEVHIIDLSCSVFTLQDIENGYKEIEVPGDMKYIQNWEDLQMGGK